MQENTSTHKDLALKLEASVLQRLRERLLTDQDGLLTQTRTRLLCLAQARGVAPDAFDDVVQETLFEAWNHLDRLHAPVGFSAWIDEICRNICRRYARRRAFDLLRYTPLSRPPSVLEQGSDVGEGDLLTEMYPADTSDPLEEVCRQDMVLLLDRALGVLPEQTRQVVEMCHLLELPRPEAAARLGLSSGALETRLHRARRDLRRILSGPLRNEAEAFGFALDEVLAEGWQETRLWCPLCARCRLQGCFVTFEAGEEGQEGPNLHLRCPDCSRRYGQDTVHSMGLVSLAGLRSFRPAWKRTMQGLTDRVVQALSQGQHPCLYCGKSALIQVKSSDSEAAPGPYPFWIQMCCAQCGKDIDASGDVPSVDQLVYWSHPRTRQFLQQHPRWHSEPGSISEYDGQQVIHFQIADLESSERLTVLAQRQTLRVLTLF